MIFLLLFWLIFVVVCHGVCPNGTVASVLDPNVCYIYQSTKTKYMEAYALCTKQNGNLVSIHSMFENVYISQEASDSFTDSEDDGFWIGANTLMESGKWSWMDKTDFDFNDWDKGQPQNLSDYNCGAVNMDEGNWIFDDCFKTKPYVCSLKNQELTTMMQPITTTTIKPTACPSTWSYSNFTGYCYRSVTTFSGTWMDALTFCRVWGAELASVHSLEESLFITNLVHISETNRTKQTWVGGFTDDLHATCNDNRPWNWTDGTLFDYGKLVYPCAGYGYCLFLYTGNQYTNMFQSWDCYSKMQQFVCKKLPS